MEFQHKQRRTIVLAGIQLLILTKGPDFYCFLLEMISTWRLRSCIREGKAGECERITALKLRLENCRVSEANCCRITESEYIWFRKSPTEHLLLMIYSYSRGEVVAVQFFLPWKTASSGLLHLTTVCSCNFAQIRSEHAIGND